MGQQMIAYSAASSYSIVFGTDLITICIDFSNAFSKKKIWFHHLNFIVIKMFNYC